MAEPIAAGTWVEIRSTVLRASERAPRIPPDTSTFPLELRAKGFLAVPAQLGEEVEIVSAAGRRLRGTLSEANPSYTHGFGRPIPELCGIAEEARAILRRHRGVR
jgi:hypothetical protein